MLQITLTDFRCVRARANSSGGERWHIWRSTVLVLILRYSVLLFSSSLSWLLLLFGCLTSQQHASVSQGRICSDKCRCCRTELHVADQTFYRTQSQYIDSGPTSPSADPVSPGACQDSHWGTNFEVSRMNSLVGLVVSRPPRERKIPGSNPAFAGIFSGSSHTSGLNIGTPVATLPGAWRYRVSAGTGRPGVSIL